MVGQMEYGDEKPGVHKTIKKENNDSYCSGSPKKGILPIIRYSKVTPADQMSTFGP